MTIGIYTQYLDSLGGGERYVMTIASHWSKTHRVELLWHDPAVLGKISERFNIDCSRIVCVPNVFASRILPVKLLASRRYDLMFFLTDGSVPMSLARKNILHVQVPFPFLRLPPPKKWMYQAVVVNSEFTKRHLDPSLAAVSRVIYPPVDISDIRPDRRKADMVLTVGRFSTHGHTKKQDVLIDAFKRGIDSGILRGYELVVAGGLMPSDRPFYDTLVDRAKGYPIRFMPNCTRADLVSLYGKARLYWHAAGFGESDPALMEHFGISTVEAMAGGAVPLSYDAGGQREIIGHGRTGILWTHPEQLVAESGNLSADHDRWSGMSQAAVAASAKYSAARFTESFDRLTSEMGL